MSFNITEQPIPTLTNNVHRQPRFGYIPLFGLLLANILSNSVLAKYAPIGALRLSYDPLPWLQKPAHHQNTHESYHHWHPPGYESPPPSLSSSEGSDQHIHHHHHIPDINQQQIVNIHERPTEILIGDAETESTDQNETTSPPITIEEINEEIPNLPLFKNSVDKPIEQSIEQPKSQPIASESRSLPQLMAFLANSTTPSSKKVKRGTDRYTKPRKNNKYISQKKKKLSTTTPDYYYDSYEEATTNRKYQPKIRGNPSNRKPAVVDSYEESESSISQSYSALSADSQEYEYDSYEYTTKPHKRRRRPTAASTTYRPKKIKAKYGTRKRQKVSSFDDNDFDDVEYDTEKIDPTTTTTESLKIRHQELLLRQQEHLQRQQESLLKQQEILQRQIFRPNVTTTTTEGSTTSSTTEGSTVPPTQVLEGNVTAGNNTKNNTGYGYGPSNGYESISITYSPTGGGGILSNGVISSGGFSPSYQAPNPSYGAPTYVSPSPSYGVPNPSYGPPSPSYGPPSPSHGPPSNTYGVPSTGTGSGGIYSQSQNGYYQLPFNDWYSNEVNRNSIVKKVHDLIGFQHVLN